ncbi:MAG: hypothetical protein DLM52_11975 [Chthoniobacterales bacterium]|nr:MAG: hypothetical protein DLM52_11975 [Chthoniobacterales bacterium]
MEKSAALMSLLRGCFRTELLRFVKNHVADFERSQWLERLVLGRDFVVPMFFRDGARVVRFVLWRGRIYSFSRGANVHLRCRGEELRGHKQQSRAR